MSSHQVEAAILEYVAAHRDAEDNPSRLLAARMTTEYTATSDDCVARMRRLAAAEGSLLNLYGVTGVPDVLEAFFAAEFDRGCTHCWMSSSRDRNHPACNEKIDRYFAARLALVESVPR